jgi:hypothetical protein
MKLFVCTLVLAFVRPSLTVAQGIALGDFVPKIQEAYRTAKNQREIDSVTAYWIILCVNKSTLTACLRNRDHLIPTLVDAREIITQFHLMIRRRLETGLTPWIESAPVASLIASFASGVARDEAAVRAAITSSWSNGQTEGQITRLKLVRRQMYGRGKSIYFKPD